jgi:hypothetical protein
MKAIVTTAFATLALLSVSLLAAPRPSTDPCRSKESNRDIRECYAKEQARVNAEANSLASKISKELSKEAGESDSVIADC